MRSGKEGLPEMLASKTYCSRGISEWQAICDMLYLLDLLFWQNRHLNKEANSGEFAGHSASTSKG